MEIQLHAVLYSSRANGPGKRVVIWFQGCTLECPGCFNPATHPRRGGYKDDTEWLARSIIGRPEGIEGVTISGGEPFQQPEALIDLLERLQSYKLSFIVFSGYTLREVQRQTLGRQILSQVDVLIAGRYIASQHIGEGLLGSANQKIHLLTRRYTHAEFNHIPKREIILHANGNKSISGIRPQMLGQNC